MSQRKSGCHGYQQHYHLSIVLCIISLGQDDSSSTTTLRGQGSSQMFRRSKRSHMMAKVYLCMAECWHVGDISVYSQALAYLPVWMFVCEQYIIYSFFIALHRRGWTHLTLSLVCYSSII